MVFDADQAVVHLSESAAELTGVQVGEPIRDRSVHPHDLPGVRDAFDRARSRPGHRVPVRFRVRTPGGWRVLDATYTDLSADPRVEGMVLHAVDLTDQLAVEEELRERSRVEETMSTVSRMLIDGAGNAFDDTVTEVLGVVGRLVAADRVTVFRTPDDGATIHRDARVAHAGHLLGARPVLLRSLRPGAVGDRAPSARGDGRPGQAGRPARRRGEGALPGRAAAQSVDRRGGDAHR